MEIIIGIVCFALGALITYFFAKKKFELQIKEHELLLATENTKLEERLLSREESLAELRQSFAKIEGELEQVSAEREKIQILLSETQARKEEELKAKQEQISLMQNMKENLQDSFKVLSGEVFQKNSQSFLELATQNLSQFQEGAKKDFEQREKNISLLVEPLKETLSKVDLRIESLEKFGANSQGMLDQQIKQLYDSHRNLSTETANLVQALRTPNVRGRWGEFQLRRVVEMAGMVEYCDFQEQAHVSDEDGRYRPDMIIKLPNNRTIVVDSKVPFSAYQEAIQAQSEEIRAERLVDHARLVKNHVTQLGSKDYWRQFESSPDFVILFLSAEPFYFAAVEKDPSLIEYAADRKVLIAAPMSLVAMLKVIAYGWRQEDLEANAREISKLGKLLYERLAVVSNHINGVKKGLESAVSYYNKAVSSLETRVFPAARKFKDLAVESGEEIVYTEAIESIPKEVIGIEVVKTDVELPQLSEAKSEIEDDRDKARLDN